MRAARTSSSGVIVDFLTFSRPPHGFSRTKTLYLLRAATVVKGVAVYRQTTGQRSAAKVCVSEGQPLHAAASRELPSRVAALAEQARVLPRSRWRLSFRACAWRRARTSDSSLPA